ncbi:MAG: type IX secretion system membrane protein PorP/SprF [Bacteroidota bacterium]
MFLVLSAARLEGQDPSFSQFYANRLYLNPGFTGIEKNLRRIFINYRNQWPSISGNYITYSASYDQYIDPMHGGFGIRLMNDVQGDGAIRQFELGLLYSYHIKITRRFSISAGIDASYVQRNLNTSGLILGDMINPRTGEPTNPTSDVLYSQNSAYPDFTVGFVSFYENFYGGVSASHLLRPNPSVSSDPNARLPRKYVIFAGGIIPVYEKRLGKEVIQLSPNIIYQQQSSFSQIIYGMEGIIQDQFVLGLWLRQNLGIKFGSLIFSAGYVTNNYRFRYSYDQQLSLPSVHIPNLGAHELSLILTIDGENKKKHRAIKCPKI